MATFIVYSDAPEIGFGSVTANPQLDITDMGFGAPEFIEYTIGADTFKYRNRNERGFGDPISEITFKVVEREDTDKLADDGGEVIVLEGQFSQLFEALDVPSPREFQPIGPFSFKFKGVDAQNLDIVYPCHGGIPSFGNKTFTNVEQTLIHFTTPAMIKGNYDLIISYANIEFTFTEQFEVIHRLRFDRTLNIRKGLPSWLNRGDVNDDIVPSEAFSKNNVSNISVLTDAMGASMNTLYDSSYTVVTSPYRFGDTVLNVETTLGFPKNGATVKVGQYDMTYTGKTTTRFTGVSFTGGVDEIRNNVRVYQKHSDFSEIQNFYKVKNNGFYKPSYNITENSFNTAFNIVEYGERPSEQVIFRYMYELFKHMNLKKNCNVSGNTISAPNDSSTFNCSHVQKLCKIDGAFFWIEGETLSTNGALILDPIGSTYWNSTKLKGDSGFDGDAYDIEILPWWIDRDDSGRFEIVFEKTVFANLTGFIDKDFIDFNIFLDAENVTNESGQNLNIGLLVPAGVRDIIRLERRCDSLFGTYYSQESAPDGLAITPIRTFL